MTTVHVVDDDDAIRDSLSLLLGAAGWSVATYSDGAALLASSPSPSGCVLTDFHMPGISGLDLLDRLAEAGSKLPVVVMTGHGDVPAAVRAMRAGAVDFLEKPFSDRQLLDAVASALRANEATLATGARREEAAARIASLTPREGEVLDLLVTGKSNKDIARALGTSPRTIDVHRARVFHKLGAATLPDLVYLVLTAKPAR